MSLRIDVLSVFPQMFEPYMSLSIMGRAAKKGALDFHAHDLRDWTHDRHRSTDDEPYGGGQGLPDHGGADCEAVLPVNVPDVQRHQGHLGIARPVQDAPHQADEAGAPALVSRLADENAAAGNVVFPGAQGCQHLTRHQMGGIAHITVDVPQAQMGQIRAFLRQQYRVPAV